MSDWDTIRSMHATFIDWQDSVKVGERTYQGKQAWETLKAHGSIHSGAPKLKQLPEAKKNYKG